MKSTLIVVFIATLIIGVFISMTIDEESIEESDTGSNDVVTFLSSASSDAGFSAVTPGYEISLPKDFGAHTDYRQEWWYFTGVLSSESSRRFGYQLTFFRFSDRQNVNLTGSKWDSSDIWMAHFAVSDITSQQQIANEDYSRGAIALAGVKAQPFSVWLNGWSVSTLKNDTDEKESTWLLHANDKGVSLKLYLRLTGEPVLQGESGYSVKDENGDSASYYFSFPHIQTTGELTVENESFQVQGTSWMDREWSTSVLTRNQLGWDWMGLRFTDGSSLMVFQVRRANGRPYRYAMFIDSKGVKTKISSDEIELQADKYWQTSHTEEGIPTVWLLSISSIDLKLTVSAAFDNQFLDLVFPYWEGVVDVSGSIGNTTLKGDGYLEMTGY